MQAMCQVYAAVSYICIGDAESSSQVKILNITENLLFRQNHD